VSPNGKHPKWRKGTHSNSVFHWPNWCRNSVRAPINGIDFNAKRTECVSLSPIEKRYNAGSIMRSQCYCDSASDQSEKKASYITHNDWSIATTLRSH